MTWDGHRTHVWTVRMKRHWLKFVVVLTLLALIPGCGGCGVSGRGRNSDFDRPKVEK
jgi:hypothetical protein